MGERSALSSMAHCTKSSSSGGTRRSSRALDHGRQDRIAAHPSLVTPLVEEHPWDPAWYLLHLAINCCEAFRALPSSGLYQSPTRFIPRATSASTSQWCKTSFTSDNTATSSWSSTLEGHWSPAERVSEHHRCCAQSRRTRNHLINEL